MAKKFKVSKNRSEIEALQRLETKANNWPAPGSKMNGEGKLANFCPACGWTQAAGPRPGCSATHGPPVEVAPGKWATLATGEIDDAIKAAKAKPVNARSEREKSLAAC